MIPIQQDITIDQYSGESFVFPAFVDANGLAIDLSAKAVKFRAQNSSLVVQIKYDSTGGNMSITGAGHNIVTVFFSPADILLNQQMTYTLWNATDSLPLAKGKLTIAATVNPSP